MSNKSLKNLPPEIQPFYVLGMEYSIEVLRFLQKNLEGSIREQIRNAVGCSSGTIGSTLDRLVEIEWVWREKNDYLIRTEGQHALRLVELSGPILEGRSDFLPGTILPRPPRSDAEDSVSPGNTEAIKPGEAPASGHLPNQEKEGLQK